MNDLTGKLALVTGGGNSTGVSPASRTAGPNSHTPVGVRLDRIRFDRTHIVGSIDLVNPVYIYKVEQIHGR